MPVPIDFLRGMLGLLCAFFGYMLGRSAARWYNGASRASQVYAWAIRTLVTYGAILWRHGMDVVSLVVMALSLAAAAIGIWMESRPRKPEEDLSRQIFPE